MDVDVGGTPEPEGLPNDTARDGESDEIVRQLEKGLPRWEGFGDMGWMDEVDPVRLYSNFLIYVGLTAFRIDIWRLCSPSQDTRTQGTCVSLFLAENLTQHQSANSGVRLAATLEAVPEDTVVPELPFNVSILWHELSSSLMHNICSSHYHFRCWR